MSSFWNFLFGTILIILWVVSGGFITAANANLTSYRDTDENLHRAYWFTFWGAFVTWSLIILFIILVILSIIGLVALFGSGVGEVGVAAEGVEGEAAYSQYARSPEGQQLITSGISWLTIGFLIFALILVSITGVLAAIAASSMAASPHFDRTVQSLETAYTDCIIAASVCLGAAGLLIIGVIVYFIIGWRQQQARDNELAQIRQLQRQAFLRRVQERAQTQQLAQLQEQALRQQLLQQALATTSASISTPTTGTPVAAGTSVTAGAPVAASTPTRITPISLVPPAVATHTLTTTGTQQGVTVSLPSSLTTASGVGISLPPTVSVPLPTSISRYLS